MGLVSSTAEVDCNASTGATQRNEVPCVHRTEMRKQPAGPLPQPPQEVRFDLVQKAPGDHDVQGMFDIRQGLARFHRGAMGSAEHGKDASDGVKNQENAAII